MPSDLKKLNYKQMKRIIAILLIGFITLLNVYAQNYIGLHKDEIVQVMKTSQRNFKLNTDAVNSKYRYLKFEDKTNEQTMLCFLSDEDYCTYVRLMCDYANFNTVLDTLNKKYTKKDKYNWIFNEKGESYIVNMDKGEWFFTVSIKKK